MEKIKYNVALVGAESQDLQLDFDDIYEIARFIETVFDHQAEDISVTISIKKYEKGEKDNGSTE